MSRKTERIYATAEFDGENAETTAASFVAAVGALNTEGARQKREVLFDTLEVEMDVQTVDQSSLTGKSQVSETYKTVVVSAQAVKL